MYRIYDNTNGKIVSFCNITFIEQLQSNAPSTMVNDTDEGSKSSDYLENVYDGTTNMESTSSDDVSSVPRNKIKHHKYKMGCGI